MDNIFDKEEENFTYCICNGCKKSICSDCSPMLEQIRSLDENGCFAPQLCRKSRYCQSGRYIFHNDIARQIGSLIIDTSVELILITDRFRNNDTAIDFFLSNTDLYTKFDSEEDLLKALELSSMLDFVLLTPKFYNSLTKSNKERLADKAQ